MELPKRIARGLIPDAMTCSNRYFHRLNLKSGTGATGRQDVQQLADPQLLCIDADMQNEFAI